jgi:uncharacterized protein (TIGR02145 family)
MNKILKIQELKALLDEDAITKDEYQLLLKEVMSVEDYPKEFPDTSNSLIDYNTTKDLKFENFGDDTYRVSKWLKTIGAKIEIGDPYLEIETDKALIEVPANVSGVLIEQLFPVGYSVSPNEIIGRVETDERKALKIIENSAFNFESIKIGIQEWMTQNLNVRYFRNGDYIPEAKTIREFLKAWEDNEPAWIYYGEDYLNSEEHGVIYNKWAILDERGLAPKGWKIPSEADWGNLCHFIGGFGISAKLLKSTRGWCDETANGIDKFGFNAKPGGNIGFYRHHWQSKWGDGIHESLSLWSLTNDLTDVKSVSMSWDDAIGIDIGNFGNYLRCLKE